MYSFDLCPFKVLQNLAINSKQVQNLNTHVFHGHLTIIQYIHLHTVREVSLFLTFCYFFLVLISWFFVLEVFNFVDHLNSSSHSSFSLILDNFVNFVELGLNISLQLLRNNSATNAQLFISILGALWRVPHGRIGENVLHVKICFSIFE